MSTSLCRVNGQVYAIPADLTPGEILARAAALNPALAGGAVVTAPDGILTIVPPLPLSTAAAPERLAKLGGPSRREAALCAAWARIEAELLPALAHHLNDTDLAEYVAPMRAAVAACQPREGDTDR